MSMHWGFILASLTVIVTRIATNAQFAVVDDADGFANVRGMASTGAQLQDTLHNGHLVYCFERNGNWINIDYLHNTAAQNGYLYRDRVKMVDAFPSISSARHLKDKVILAKDSISINVAARAFVPAKHKLVYNADRMLARIDGNEVWGQDGGMPGREYASIELRIGVHAVSLPTSALAGLYEPNLSTLGANYDELRRTVYIHSANSDAGGGYLVIWRIVDGVYKERYVTHGF